MEEEGNPGIYCTREPFFISFLKLPRPDWEYRVTPYIVTSADPLSSLLSFFLLPLSMLCSLCFILQRRLPEIIYCSWPLLRTCLFLRRYYSTCERWSFNQSFSSSFSFLVVVFNCNEMYYRMFHLISLKNRKKNIEKHRFLLREKKNY